MLEVQIISPKPDLGVKGICEVSTSQGGLDITHIFLIFTGEIFLSSLLCRTGFSRLCTITTN